MAQIFLVVAGATIYVRRMKLFKLLAAAVLAPMFLLASANADDAAKGKGKGAAASTKPSLTYYYFDG